MTKREFEDLREWVKHTEQSISDTEETVSDILGDIKVLKNTQKFVGWLTGILLTANLALLSFVLMKLFELASRLK